MFICAVRRWLSSGKAGGVAPGRRTRYFAAMIRLMRYLILIILWFIGISLALVILYRFVPVPVTATMLLDKHGITKDWTPLSRIDRDMVDAAIGAEDSKFCSHHGFDRKAIEKAIAHDRKSGVVLRGGSTISQQTAKNVFLWQGGGFFRKGLEAWFTFLIEHLWGKRRIMEVYLNVAETGIGTYGVQAGAERYYHHSAARLAPIEAARLAAILPLPKQRKAIDPSGFTRRYGNTIAARIGVVRRDGLDACVYK
jgi:monofunctional biosynthetic peptidoglycan transglycosylase